MPPKRLRRSLGRRNNQHSTCLCAYIPHQAWKPQPSPASTHGSHKGSAMNLHIKGHPPSLCQSLTTRPDWPTWAYCTGLLILPSSSLLAGILGCHHNCDPDSGGGCYKGGPLCRPSVHMSLDFWLYVLCLVWVASLVLLSLGFHICKNKAPVDWSGCYI